MIVASFDYKLWNVYISEVFGNFHEITFTVNFPIIYFRLLEIAKDNGVKDNTKVKSEIEKFYKELQLASDLNKVKPLKVSHWGRDILEKCKNDGINYIDNNLGNAFEYLLKQHKFSPNIFIKS